MEYMDGGLISSKVGRTMPELTFYSEFLQLFNLTASECILVDDTEENVIAAEKLGMNGIVFKTYKELVWEISNTTGVTVI